MNNALIKTAVAAALAAAGAAHAQSQCYDFSGLSVGAQYHIGDTVNARHATITFEPYTMGGNPVGGFGTSNFEVNGERHEGPSFASANGKRLGGAEITANLANTAGNWHVGTLEINAKPGGSIASFSIGGHTWRLDDMCFAK